MTNQQIIDFHQKFGSLANLVGYDFVMELNRNFLKVEKEMKVLDSLHDPNGNIKEYRKAATKLYQEFSEKDLTGSPRVEPIGAGQQRIVVDPDKETEFGVAFKALKKKHQKELDLQEVRDQEYTDAMTKESSLKLKVIKKDIIPKDMTAGQMRLLFSVGMLK